MAVDPLIFLLTVVAVLIAGWLFMCETEPIHNEGSLYTGNKALHVDPIEDENAENDLSENDQSRDKSGASDTNDSADDSATGDSADDSAAHDSATNDLDTVESSVDIIKERAMGQNGPYFRRKSGGKYKHNSYRAVGENDDLRNIDKHFKIPDIAKNYTDRYVPTDESDGQNAPVNIRNNKGTEKDKYDIDAFLPQEKEKDWFETIETVDVKNSHLINIYRPIGANTIGSTHKNSTYDLRGTDKAVCPKFVVSPWMQSSIEPDRSMKSLCG